MLADSRGSRAARGSEAAGGLAMPAFGVEASRPAVEIGCNISGSRNSGIGRHPGRRGD
ncbi:hypothetical protein D9M68_999050 [compost metagenome]